MTTIEHDSTGVTVRFPGWEALMAGRSVLRIPATAIRDARCESDWSSEILGVRSGLVVSGFLKLGTFTHPSGARRLVAMRRGRPLLRLITDRRETGFDEVLLSTSEARAVAESMAEVGPR